MIFGIFKQEYLNVDGYIIIIKYFDLDELYGVSCGYTYYPFLSYF